MKKKWAIIFLLPICATAQTRNEFWLKLNVSHFVTQKLTLGIDLHHRRQANFETTDKNIFHYPLGNYARAWMSYKLKKGWTLVFSPIGYFDNEDILNSAGEFKQTNELRISPGITKEWNMGNLKNKNRLLYDARFAEYNKPGHFFQSRFRMQNSISIPLGKKHHCFFYLFSNEILIKKEKNKPGFDQDRVYNAIQYKIKKQEVDLGYQWVLQNGSTRIFHRNQLFIMVNISI